MSLLTRFDAQALEAPAGSGASVPGVWLDWCQSATGAFAWCHCDASLAELNALMRELDGDRALQALASGAARWQWRISLKLREALGLRRAQDPWDAGHLRDLDALLRFEPRRPTLIVGAAGQSGARELLAARSPLFKHPVRLLLRP